MRCVCLQMKEQQKEKKPFSKKNELLNDNEYNLNTVRG
jgi:hypothetical protein